MYLFQLFYLVSANVLIPTRATIHWDNKGWKKGDMRGWVYLKKRVNGEDINWGWRSVSKELKFNRDFLPLFNNLLSFCLAFALIQCSLFPKTLPHTFPPSNWKIRIFSLIYCSGGARALLLFVSGSGNESYSIPRKESFDSWRVMMDGDWWQNIFGSFLFGGELGWDENFQVIFTFSLLPFPLLIFNKHPTTFLFLF